MERSEQTQVQIQKKKRRMTERLLKLFLRHIGVEDGLTIWEILGIIYGAEKMRAMNKFERFFYWSRRVRPAINRLKMKKRLFVMEMPYRNKNVWFALKTHSELVYFQTKCAAAIDGLENMSKLAAEAFRDQWHKQRLKEKEGE